VWNSFDRITWSFQNKLLLNHSTDPTTTKQTASIATTQRTKVRSFRFQLTSRNSPYTSENGTKKKQTFCSPFEKSGE
jgi:hypothetical protein